MFYGILHSKQFGSEKWKLDLTLDQLLKGDGHIPVQWVWEKFCRGSLPVHSSNRNSWQNMKHQIWPTWEDTLKVCTLRSLSRRKKSEEFEGCRKTFLRKDSLYKHVKVHQKSEPVEAHKECDMSMPLKIHVILEHYLEFSEAKNESLLSYTDEFCMQCIPNQTVWGISPVSEQPTGKRFSC